jgi:serine/threonine-protein kinase HipA
MKTLSLLEVAHDGQRIGHLICEVPDVWLFRPAAAAGPVPRWSALAGEANMAVNRRAWFRGLLPDPLECARLAQRLGISVGNEFAVLGLRGEDCAGALGFARPGTATGGAPGGLAPGVGLDEGALAALARGEALAAVDSLPWLLPGDPGQFPCSLVDGRLTVAAGTADWIARTGRQGLPEAVENEALCLRVAAALGLPVPAAELRRGAVPVLLTRRVDRHLQPDRVHRRHLEDFCQLSGLHPEQAYEREGGLAVLDCAALIRRFSVAPALDIRALLGWLVLCFLAGIGQAHARTLCLVETARGPRLAIVGGLLSTHVYPGLSARMAMYIGREDRPDWIRLARWREMAEELGVGTRYLLEMLRQMATRVPLLAEAAAAELDLGETTLKVVPRILKLIGNRARQSLIALEAERE